MAGPACLAGLACAVIFLAGPAFAADPVAPDWTQGQPGVEKGIVSAMTIADPQYRRARKLWVYTPPGYDAQRGQEYRLLVFFDGESYLDDIPAPTVLDNLLAQKRIPPTLAVFVDNNEARLADLANQPAFADFVVKDLLPWVRKNYRVSLQAQAVTLAGFSAGGLAAAYIGWKYPSAIGKVLSQSGAFWRGNEGGSGDTEWLTRQYAAAAKLPLRFYLEVGGGEVGKTIGGISMVEANRHLRSVLEAHAYPLQYVEVDGALHSPEHWRTQLGAGLIYLNAELP